MSANCWFKSSDSEVFYVQHLSNEPSPPRNITPQVLISTELSGVHPTEAITISTNTSPRPRNNTLSLDSKDPTTPCSYERQNPIATPILNDLNLPCNLFNMLAPMEVMHAEPITHHKHHSPQSSEPSEQSPISTAPMNRSTIDGRKTAHATTDDNTFHSEDELRKILLDVSPNGTFQSYEELRVILLEQCSPFTPRTPKAVEEAQHVDVLTKKRGERRSISARHAGKSFQQKRTSQVVLKIKLRFNKQ